MAIKNLLIFVLLSNCALAQPSTNRIIIDTANNFWPITGKENPERLFNNETDRKMDDDDIINFASPMEFYIELKDSVWEDLSLRFYNGFGATQTWTVGFYDSTRTLRGTYSFTGTILPFFGYVTMPGTPDTISVPIRYIYFTVTNAATDVREIEVYADRVAKASTLIPAVVTPTVLTDPGIYHLGGSALGDKDTNYLKIASGKPLYPSFRSPTSIFVWNHSHLSTFSTQPVEMDLYGDMDKQVLSFFKSRGSQVMFYTNGANIKVRPDLDSTMNYSTLTALNIYKDIPVGSDSTDPANWALNTARTFKALSALWGNNASAVLPPTYLVFGNNSPNLTKGQNKVQVMEIGNEDDKTWYGNTGYHSPKVLWAKLKASYDSVKSIDASMEVHIGALFSADTVIWKSVFAYNFWITGSTDMPCDGLNFNQYISNAYGGQPQGGLSSAVSPEQFQVTERATAYANFRDRMYPGRQMRWTEVGFSFTESDYNVVAVTGIPDSINVAAFMIRTLERAMMVPNAVNAVYNYFHTSDGSGTFAGMYMVQELFNQPSGSYAGSRRLPIWYAYATRVNTLWDYTGWSTTITNGDSTGVNLVRRDHNTDPNKKVYTIWRGTYNGSTSANYSVNVGSATSVTLVTFAHEDEDGVQTALTVAGNAVTVPSVTENPQYLIVNLGAASLPSTNFRKRGLRYRLKN